MKNQTPWISRVVDSIVAVFSPQAAYNRVQSRLALEKAARNYEAAQKGRRTKNWHSSSSSPSRTVGPYLAALRDKSRDLSRNNAYAVRAVNSLTNSIVGGGIVPSVVVKSTSATASAKREARIKALFKDWAEVCDFDGRMGFYGLQALIIRTVIESGECLIIKKRTTDPNAPIKLQIVEGDLLDHTKDGYTTQDSGFIRYGVEFDGQGQRVAYWLFTKHPGEGMMYQSQRIPAEDVIHVYECLRPQQVRGVPFGAPAMLRVYDYDKYEDTQLIRQQIAACFSVFVTQENAGQFVSDMDRLERVEPGIIEYLAPGQQVAFASPPPAEGYAEYTTRVLRGIAAAYRVTYEQISNDYSQVNFSSARMGWIEHGRDVVTIRNTVVFPALTAIWRWFMEGAMITGKVDKFYSVEWKPPRREMIDPVKETTALEKQVQAGFKTWAEALRELGYDPDEQIAEIKQYNDALDEAGIKLTSDARTQIPPSSAPSGGSGDTTDTQGDPPATN